MTAADSWQEEGLHFFVFELKPVDGATSNAADPPVAVFTMHSEEPAPISVVVVTPTADGEAEVIDLRQPEHAYTVAFPATATENALAEPSSHPGNPDVRKDGSPSSNLHSAEQMDAGIVLTEVEAVASVAAISNTADSQPVDRDETRIGDHTTQTIEEAPPVIQDQANVWRPPDRQSVAVEDPLLTALKHSPEYQSVQSRLEDPEPVDVWQDEHLKFFVFQLHEVDQAFANDYEPTVAVFAVQPEGGELASAVIVTPGRNGGDANVRNVLEYENMT